MITVAVGCTGSGKSEIVRRLIRNHAAQYRAVIVHDPNGQWRGPLLKRAGLENPDGSAIEPSALRSVAELHRGAHKRIVRFPQLLGDDLPELAHLASSYHPARDMEARDPDVALVLDELRLACTPQGWVGGQRGPFVDLLYNHRHLGVHIYACTQSPKVVDANVLGNADVIYLCRLQKLTDYQWVRGFCGEEYERAARDLTTSWPLECVLWSPMCEPEKLKISEL